MANSVTFTNVQAIGAGGGGLGSVVLSGTPSSGQVPVATSSTTATWGAPGLPATPAPLTSSQVLTRAAHANVNIEIASATAINIDVPDPTTCTVGDEFRDINKDRKSVV